MAEKKGTVPFRGTPEQEAQLMQVIEEHKADKGALIHNTGAGSTVHGHGKEGADICGYMKKDWSSRLISRNQMQDWQSSS